MQHFSDGHPIPYEYEHPEPDTIEVELTPDTGGFLEALDRLNQFERNRAALNREAHKQPIGLFQHLDPGTRANLPGYKPNGIVEAVRNRTLGPWQHLGYNTGQPGPRTVRAGDIIGRAGTTHCDEHQHFTHWPPHAGDTCIFCNGAGHTEITFTTDDGPVRAICDGCDGTGHR